MYSSEVFNFLVGCIVSVYMLFGKETFAAQIKKMLYAGNAGRARQYGAAYYKKKQ